MVTVRHSGKNICNAEEVKVRTRDQNTEWL